MGVGNIHAVRKSWDALEALCFDRDAATSANFGAQVCIWERCSALL